MEQLQIIETTVTEECAVVTLRGHLMALAAADVKSEFARLIGEGHTQLVVDLTQVPYVDSAGLAALVSGLKVTREAGGKMVLVGLDEFVHKLFRLTLLDRVFESYPDVESALNAISG